MRSKQHLNYRYKWFNGCQAVSDVHQKRHTGQSSGCCCWTFRRLKAKTDPGEELNCTLYESKTPFTSIHLSYQRTQHCPAGVLIPSAPVMQWLMRARSSISALPGSDFFLLRLSPAQLACMSLCTEKAWSNLSCECVLAESRGGLDTLEWSGCLIRAEARMKEEYWNILFICFSDSIFFFLFREVLDVLTPLDL